MSVKQFMMVEISGYLFFSTLCFEEAWQHMKVHRIQKHSLRDEQDLDDAAESLTTAVNEEMV